MPEIDPAGAADRVARPRSVRFGRLRPFLTAIVALSLIGGGGAPSLTLAMGSRPASAPAVPASAGASVAGAILGRAGSARQSVVPSRHAAGIAQAKPRSSTGSSHRSTTRPSRASTGIAYRGVNHVWIPSLGVNRSVGFFSCSRSSEPANYVYRWGCAGSNNVYLLGHAWGVFKPLHDAYYSGRLRVGMEVVYADGSGHVHAYRVQWWKVVAPTTAASWAWASLSRPSMTLQTCLGSNSQYRLMVRLARVW
jgi:hypothetical protein